MAVDIHLRWITGHGVKRQFGFLNRNYAKTTQYGTEMENTKDVRDIDLFCIKALTFKHFAVLTEIHACKYKYMHRSCKSYLLFGTTILAKS